MDSSPSPAFWPPSLNPVGRGTRSLPLTGRTSPLSFIESLVALLCGISNTWMEQFGTKPGARVQRICELLPSSSFGCGSILLMDLVAVLIRLSSTSLIWLEWVSSRRRLGSLWDLLPLDANPTRIVPRADRFPLPSYPHVSLRSIPSPLSALASRRQPISNRTSSRFRSTPCGATCWQCSLLCDAPHASSCGWDLHVQPPKPVTIQSPLWVFLGLRRLGVHVQCL